MFKGRKRKQSRRVKTKKRNHFSRQTKQDKAGNIIVKHVQQERKQNRFCEKKRTNVVFVKRRKQKKKAKEAIQDQRKKEN